MSQVRRGGWIVCQGERAHRGPLPKPHHRSTVEDCETAQMPVEQRQSRISSTFTTTLPTLLGPMRRLFVAVLGRTPATEGRPPRHRVRRRTKSRRVQPDC